MTIEKKNAGLMLGLAVLAILPFVTSGYAIFVVNLLLVYLVLALGLHIVIGEAGQFSFAHTAFYGVGIYTAGILNNAFHLPFVLTIFMGGLLAALIGLAVGGLALRMRDIYLALVTFAFGEVMQWVFLNWTSLTGGSSGMRMTPANLFGYEVVTDKQAYLFVVVFAALFIWATIHISRSRLGMSMRAVRESEVAAMAMGVNVQRIKISAFAISAFYAGCAGGMFTLFSSFIHPESLGLQTTIMILIMIVVGGLGSVYGAIGGAIVFGLLFEALRSIHAGQEIVYGAVLMLCMMYAPRGVLAFFVERVNLSRKSQ